MIVSIPSAGAQWRDDSAETHPSFLSSLPLSTAGTPASSDGGNVCHGIQSLVSDQRLRSRECQSKLKLYFCKLRRRYTLCTAYTIFSFGTSDAAIPNHRNLFHGRLEERMPFSSFIVQTCDGELEWFYLDQTLATSDKKQPFCLLCSHWLWLNQTKQDVLRMVAEFCVPDLCLSYVSMAVCCLADGRTMKISRAVQGKITSCPFSSCDILATDQVTSESRKGCQGGRGGIVKPFLFSATLSR